MLAHLGHAHELARPRRATSPTPQPPPETTHHAPRPRAGRAARARLRSGSAAAGTPRRSAGARAARCPRPAIRSTEGIDSPYMTRCMSIPGCAQKNRPVRSVIVATVGQLTSPRAAQPREHDGDRRVGRDDDVGVVLGDRARERARAERAQQRAARAQRIGQHVLEQPVDDRVAPGDEAQLHAVAVLDDRAQHAPHRGEAVDHRDLGALGRALDLLRPARARRPRAPRRRRRRGSGRARGGPCRPAQASVAVAFAPSHLRN